MVINSENGSSKESQNVRHQGFNRDKRTLSKNGRDDEEKHDKKLKKTSGGANVSAVLESGFLIGNDTLKPEVFLETSEELKLSQGRLEIEKEINTTKGQLTQAIFDLIRTNTLTIPTLLNASDKVTCSTAENKFVLLRRRYYAENGHVYDIKRKNLPVVEPKKLFDFIMNAHLLNDHTSFLTLHSELSDHYANITLSFCKLVCSFCSLCNPNGEKIKYRRFRHENIHEALMPLERCQIEIFKPFGDDSESGTNGEERLIAGRYPYVLYCRDYYSRYVWLEPLLGNLVDDVEPVIAKLLFNMIRVPIFIDTCTVDRQDMFDICERVARKYRIKIGLGLHGVTTFQKNGIRRAKELFAKNYDDCMADWNMCLKHIVRNNNQTYSDRARGVPSDLLCSNVPIIHKKFRTKQRQIIAHLMGHHVVQFIEAGGALYLEDEQSPDIVIDGNKD